MRVELSALSTELVLKPIQAMRKADAEIKTLDSAQLELGVVVARKIPAESRFFLLKFSLHCNVDSTNIWLSRTHLKLS